MPVTKTQNTTTEPTFTPQEKVIALFQFIRELNKLKQKTIVDVKDYPWSLSLRAIHEDPENISIFYRDRVEDEDGELDSVLLSVRKPEFDPCPEPDHRFSVWLMKGWEDFHNNVEVKEFLVALGDILAEGVHRIARPMQEHVRNQSEDPKKEHFSDDPVRVESFNSWLTRRNDWAEKQKCKELTRTLFGDLYRLYFELQRDSETMEIIAAAGMLYDKETPELRHPVLTHRVKLNYDAEANVVSIEDTAASSELYAVAFQMLNGINISAIHELRDELQKQDFHPLDRNETPTFLKTLVHQLSSESVFSEEGVPNEWKKNARLLLSVDPCYIVRKRLDGTLKAIEQIIENIEETGEIPKPIEDIACGGTIELPADLGEETVEEQLAAVGGESVEILLSKEANKEQLEIAKRIEDYNAVLVQGPPGTGKTHTIANLMGHFLAQGKSVLVTSYTKKALSVLKEKVADGLQDLCVSVLDDSNLDMEKSVDGITGYMSKTTVHEMKRDMDLLAAERREIIEDLAEVRRKIFRIIDQECKAYVYEGEELSPSKMAVYVLENKEELSYIPGKVRTHTTLPLTFDQLMALYRSNESLTPEDEKELANDLPIAVELVSPEEFAGIWENYTAAQKRLENLCQATGWQVTELEEEQQIEFVLPTGVCTVNVPETLFVKDLREYTAKFENIQSWMKAAAVDGKNEGAYRQRWLTLMEQIRKTEEYAQMVLTEQFGHSLQFRDPSGKAVLKQTYEALRSVLAEKGHVPKLTMLFHKEYGEALQAVTVDGHAPSSAADCDLVLHAIEMDSIRSQCASYWDELLSVHGVPKFLELDLREQERVAAKWIPDIEKYLNWYAVNYELLMEKLEACDFPAREIFAFNTLDSELAATDKILSAVSTTIPQMCTACDILEKIRAYDLKLKGLKTVLTSGRRGNSTSCAAVLDAVQKGDTHAYADAYGRLEDMVNKYILQGEREKMLRTLEPVAPLWAESIRNRAGIHGACTVPSNIEEAWKWKQFAGVIDEITAQPFRDLQVESLRLSQEYRRITALYAEKCAWFHLLRRTEADIDMKQALQGWKQTVKRIGKGTGKNAPALKAKARELMTRCQRAVPGWIMPIGRALETLNPKKNKFDIIIIDEASQADIASLSILYMGSKLIIVGDDRQVSPMAVGVPVDQMNALEHMYIKGKIPNSHLYNGKTSVYDIAATTFQPLMLREHFRCVPEIIGFSNMLSYDHKIKPLRDASSSNLLPAVVNVPVPAGQREGKVNYEEARTIVALMQACMEQPEYQGKSFGVISLLGDEQVKLLQTMIEEQIDPMEIFVREILCGNSANFQGDERDVIFLSMVDSGNGDGPLHMVNFGADDATRKRYNVAASRARDQLWLVHSLDPIHDLKPGDIRKTLIEYAENPQNEAKKIAATESRPENPFEETVVADLRAKGYHMEQHRSIGAYCLDMVAVCGKKAVAIECDGERIHNGEASIREDMEQQTILERLGWRFIRIRGSEYYKNPKKAISRIIRELEVCEIFPEKPEDAEEETQESELLVRVRKAADDILFQVEENLHFSDVFGEDQP